MSLDGNLSGKMDWDLVRALRKLRCVHRLRPYLSTEVLTNVQRGERPRSLLVV